jgi:hypothetical protein
MMSDFYFVVLFSASIRAVGLSTAITFYSIILRLFQTDYTGCTHVHRISMDEVQ